MNPFARLKLAHRLAGGFGLVLALLVLTTAFALSRMQSLSSTLEDVAIRGAERSHQIAAMERAANDYLLTLNALSGAALDEAVAMVGEMQKAGERHDAALAAVRPLVGDDPRAPALLEQAGAAGKAMREILERARQAADGRELPAVVLNLRGQLTGPDAAKWRQRRSAWSQSIAALADWDLQANRERSVAARADAQNARGLVVGGALVALLIGAFTAWRLTRDIGAGLRAAVEATEHMAAHDLSRPITTRRHDELGQLARSLEAMRQSLHALASGVREACQGIATASGEITQGSHDLSQRTEQTAAALQSTAGSIAQLTSMLDQTVHTAGSAGSLAREAQQVAHRGGGVVTEAVATMQEIDGASRRIADIIGIIDGIAFQTNILALNAAVEAARAGDQGRGFAVVAGEVRALAQRSAGAAREIKGLIQASLDKVASGSTQVRNAGGATTEIMSSVERVSDLVTTLSDEAAQQRDGIDQAGRSVAQLDTMAQQNAALAEQSAAAAASLLEQARRLSGLVGTFRLGGTDGAALTAA